MVKLLGERKKKTQGVQRKTDLCSAEQKKTEQLQKGNSTQTTSCRFGFVQQDVY
jgi:hypothetical protein